MDTVIGRVGGKVIMTFDFTLCNFMFGLLLKDKSSFEVSEKAAVLKATLTGGGFAFGDIIPVALTDNGGEFSNVLAIENPTRSRKSRKTILFSEISFRRETPSTILRRTL